MGKAKITCTMCGGTGQIGIRQKDGTYKWVACGECRNNQN